MKQGASVMCVHIKFRPRSSTIEQIENHKNSSIFRKFLNEQKYQLQRKYFSGVKNAALY